MGIWKRLVTCHEPFCCRVEPLISTIPSELASGCREAERQRQVGERGKDDVLEHVVLDIARNSVAVEGIGDASLQSTSRYKRLLGRGNSVLCFRVVITVLAVCMLMVTSLLTWKFTRRYGEQTVKSLAFILRHQILQSSLSTMSCVLGQAYNISLALSSMHQHVLLTQINASWPLMEKELRGINWGFFHSESELSSVAFISPNGSVTDFTRGNQSEFLFLVNQPFSGMKPVWYSQNVTGSANGSVLLPPKECASGPYEDGDLAALMRQRIPVWSIEASDMNGASFSNAIPVMNPETNEFLGMSSVTTTVHRLNHYLSTLDLLGGYLYFFWTNGSNDSSLIATSSNSSNDALLDPRMASNPVIAEAAQYLESTHRDSLLSLKEIHSEGVKLHGRKFYIDTMLLTSFKSLNLTAVLLTPRSSIMEALDSQGKTIIFVSVGTATGLLGVGFFLICFLTRKMSTEMQLRQELIKQLVAKDRAEQSSNYKSQFLANMSHELRTPVAGIIGLLDLLACDNLTAEQEDSVAQIHHCARGLLAVVNNVLDISKVETGKMELEVAPFDVFDELESLVDMFAAQSLSSGIDVVLDLSDEIPRVLKGDSAHIRQIFSNLLSNSIKFTTSGHILIRGWVDQLLLTMPRKSIEIHLQDKEKASDQSQLGSELHLQEDKIVLVFEVDDTGCGIPAEIQETVFERFVQADSSTTRSHGGSGLGLYIVRSLVNMMGGNVHIDMKDGPGTRIGFHLVLDKVRSSEFDSFVCRPLNLTYRDGLSALVQSPMKRLNQLRTPSPEFLRQSCALVAMRESIGRSVVVQWFERRGLKVVSTGDWEEIIPTLEKICKHAASGSVVAAPVRMETVESSSALEDFQPFPLALMSSGPNPFGLENTLEWKSPVLALIDVALMPRSLPNLEELYSKDAIAGFREACLGRLDLKRMPLYLQDLMDSIQRIHAKHALLVGWVVTPDSGPLKQILQSVSSSIVLSKPLHCSRLSRLLYLLADLEKIDQPHSEVLSYLSSDLSTPQLTGPSSPLKEAFNASEKIIDPNIASPQSPDEFAVHQCHSYHQPKMAVEDYGSCDSRVGITELSKAESLLPERQVYPVSSLSCTTKSHMTEETKEFNFQKRLLVKFSPHIGIIHDDSTSSTPDSPTSGLITPVGVHSVEDGVHELQKDDTYARELESDWNVPARDLRIATNTKWATKQCENASVHPPDQISVSVSAGESPSTTEPTSPSSAGSTFGAGSGALANMRVLLVEDTPVLQRLTSKMLTKLGAQVTVVSDGCQALEAVTQVVKSCDNTAEVSQENECLVQSNICQNFDLILMDCAMPIMDGYSSTKAIREAEVNTGHHIPIVALTAHALASDEEKCLAAGMDAYLTKPINCKQMVTTVRNLVLGNKN